METIWKGLTYDFGHGAVLDHIRYFQMLISSQTSSSHYDYKYW